MVLVNIPGLLRSQRVHILLLVVLGLGIYGQTVFFPFVHDDLVFIQGNPDIATLKDLPQIFFAPPQTQPGIAIANTYYRPLLEVYYRLVYAVFGMMPAAYHALNVFLHIINSLLVYKIIERLLSRSDWSFLAAALFLAHPVQTEAVACVSGVSNLILSLLLLAAFYCFLRSRLDNSSTAFPHLTGSVLGLYVVSLFVKEQAVVLPVLLLMTDVCFFAKEWVWTKEKQALPIGVWGLTGGYLLARRFLLPGDLLSAFGPKNEMFLRLAAIPNILLTQLRLCFWPFGQHYYRSADILAPAWPGMVGLIIVLGVFIGVIIRLSRQGHLSRACLAALGGGWFLVALLPTLNIIPLVHEYSFVAVFEHFLYLPLFGVILALLAVLDVWADKVPSRQILLLRSGAAVVIILSLLSFRQVRVWRGEVPLFEQAVRLDGRLGRVRLLLGKAYYFSGQFPRATDELRVAERILSGYLRKVTDPQTRIFYKGMVKGVNFDLAHCYEALGQFSQAAECYRTSLRLDPGDPVVLNNLGAVYLRSGEFDNAADAFGKALKENPGDHQAKTNLAVCLIHRGEVEQARKLLEEVLAADPEFLPARNNLRVLRSAPGVR